MPVQHRQISVSACRLQAGHATMTALWRRPCQTTLVTHKRTKHATKQTPAQRGIRALACWIPSQGRQNR